MNEILLKSLFESDEDETKEVNENMSVTTGIDRLPASNIVSKEALRKVQRTTLNLLSDMLSKTYGPMGSNTLLLRGSDAKTIVAEYSKDGNKVLKSALFSDPIEMSIQAQIVDITDFTDKQVGDGTTSATLLSAAIFNRLCDNFDTSATPYQIISTFKTVVEKIQEKILDRKTDVDFEDIYDICMISTNGNDKIAHTITDEIYKKYGKTVFIDTAISNNEYDTIRVFDGLSIDEGYSDAAYINQKSSGKCIIPNPKIYAFNDPIDTPEMINFANKIIIDNILSPAQDPSENFIPTVIVSPKISRDASSIIEQLVDILYRYKDNLDAKPPICVVTNLLGGNMDRYYDMAKLCGCKMIRKYIDPKIQEMDIENGVAPTLDNIHEFAGTCEQFSADGSTSTFINPGDMFEKDEEGFILEDENGGFVKSATYSNLLQFVEDLLQNSIDNSEDDNTIGNIRKRLQSLKANYVEYMVGGITIADRDSTRDLVQDAIRNCRSACLDGYGYAANYEGFRAAMELFDELEDEDEKSICFVIIKAYVDIISKLYSSVYTDEQIPNIIKDSLEHDCPFNIVTEEFDGKVITSIQTDIKILDAISKIVTIMFTANQCLVQAPQINSYN